MEIRASAVVLAVGYAPSYCSHPSAYLFDRAAFVGLLKECDKSILRDVFRFRMIANKCVSIAKDVLPESGRYFRMRLRDTCRLRTGADIGQQAG